MEEEQVKTLYIHGIVAVHYITGASIQLFYFFLCKVLCRNFRNEKKKRKKLKKLKKWKHSKL